MKVNVRNHPFWTLWNERKYTEALQLPLRVNESPEWPALGTESARTSADTGPISTGDFLYDYLRLDPKVMEGIDFTRTEDVFSLFFLSSVVQRADASHNDKIMQMQGYIAERIVAAELQAKGHDVEFPETPNEAGWDLLIDGYPFQVNMLIHPGGVKEQLEKYPDIPVYVTAEYLSQFGNHPMVYPAHVSLEDISAVAKRQLEPGSELSDFDISWISLLVSSIGSARKWLVDHTALRKSILQVLNGGSGTACFGPAGELLGSTVGVWIGKKSGLPAKIKTLFVRKDDVKLIKAIYNLIVRVSDEMGRKIKRKECKLQDLLNLMKPSEAAEALKNHIQERYDRDIKYHRDKLQQLYSLSVGLRSGKLSSVKVLPELLECIAQSGVHPCTYQSQLRNVIEIINVKKYE